MSRALKARDAELRAPQALPEVRFLVRSHLEGLARRLRAEGMPRPALDGKILRPLAAYITVPRDRRWELDQRFWWGALAVEMVHEASLLHDDILDDAAERRGKPTMAASAGVGPALVLGDHLLTSAYRAAARTRSPEFLEIFIRGVERTVAGEIAQEKSQGRVLSLKEYREAITGKSGELFRGALSLGPALLGNASPKRAGALGARLGCLYQMVDDFLDYCPDVDRGKPPLQDYRQRKWTWPLALLGARDFEADADDVVSGLFSQSPSSPLTAMEEGILQMDGEIVSLLDDLRDEGLEAELLGELLAEWARSLERATETELRRPGWAAAQRRVPSSGTRLELAEAADSLKTHAGRLGYFGDHARSFRFASRLFPSEALRQVADVYAVCRFTDDLVDEAGDEDPTAVKHRLDVWLEVAGEAHQGRDTGIPLLNDVVGEMGRAGVPFHYLESLVEGVGMDLVPRSFASMEELRGYSYRVASVVGGWLTELFAVRDPWVLDRAFALGHAMQLTNILRDVGEDLRMGRVYLPLDRMARHGVDRPLLEAMVQGERPVSPGYRALLEELMKEADEDYARAMEAIPALPSFFQGPVAVAAGVYQGIHDEIRRLGHDNLNRRARTSLFRKVGLGARALVALFMARRKAPGRAGAEPGLGPSLSPDEGEVAA